VSIVAKTAITGLSTLKRTSQVAVRLQHERRTYLTIAKEEMTPPDASMSAWLLIELDGDCAAGPKKGASCQGLDAGPYFASSSARSRRP
jgi:hypothetical protein